MRKIPSTADVKTTQEDGTVVLDQPHVGFAVKAGNIAGIKFDDLGEKLKGSTIGSTVTLEGSLPEEHHELALRGKKVTIALAIKGIKHQHLPEVNQEFATMLGFDNVDALEGRS